MSIFLHRVIDSMLEAEIPLRNQLLVLPSRRAITFFKSFMAERIDRPVLLPRIMTLEDLAQEISQLRPLDQVTTALELYDSYREVYSEAEPYETFESWTAAILRDFNTIDTYLLEADDVYRDLRLIKEINDWSFSADELVGDQIEFNRFWQRLSHLYKRFNERLEDQGRSYSGGILRKASDMVTTKRCLPSYDQITFAGFNALSPAEIAIFDSFHNEGRLNVLWDDAPYYRDNHSDPAGLFMRRWQGKSWRQSFGTEREELVQLNISSHPHAISQVTWAGSLLEKANVPSQKMAVVLADEKLLTPLLDRFPKTLERINITIGISFTDTSVFKFLESYFRLHISAQRVTSTGADWAVHHQELLRWVEMAVHYGLLGQNLLSQIESMIREERVIYFSQESLQALLSADSVSRFGLAPMDRGVILSAAIVQMKQVQSRDKLIRGVAERLSELLEEAKAVIDGYAFIETTEAMWKCIKGGLGRERISFVGEPLEGLQVMGLLETRALDFDHVILLGANEGSLPKAQRFDSFLPYDLRRHYSLPTQLEEDAVFAYYFYRLLRGASRVDIAYTSERDELGGGEESRYISQILFGIPQSAGLRLEVTQKDFAPKSKSVPRPWIEVEKSDEVRKSVIKWYTGPGISFSRISEYNSCPLDFYYRTVLGLGEQKEIEEELGSSELGNIVHQVLEDSFEPLVRKGRILPEEISRLEAGCGEIFNAVLKEKGLETLVSSGESALVHEVAKHMLQNFFKRESNRVAKQEVEVMRLEEKWELLCDVSIGGEIRALKFVAKIDRIESSQGIDTLIDYKTGKVKPEDVRLKELTAERLFDPKNSKSLQLIYYLWFYWRFTEGRLAKAGIISMVGLEEDPMLFEIEKNSIASAEQLSLFENLFFDHLDHIATHGVFAHDQKTGYYCSYCLEKAEKKW